MWSFWIVSHVCLKDIKLLSAKVPSLLTWLIYDLLHNKTNKLTCAPREDLDQPGRPPSLIRVFAVCMKKNWGLSYPLSALWRLWSDIYWIFEETGLSFVCSELVICKTASAGQSWSTTTKKKMAAVITEPYLDSETILNNFQAWRWDWNEWFIFSLLELWKSCTDFHMFVCNLRRKNLKIMVQSFI